MSSFNVVGVMIHKHDHKKESQHNNGLRLTEVSNPMSQNRTQKFQKSLSTEIERISNLSESISTDEFLKQNMPIITCECGADILIVPDLKAMDRAIETHSKKHGKKQGPLKRTEETSGYVRELLCELLLKKISKLDVS